MAGEIIRPSALPDRPSPVASEKVPVDNGATVAGATIEALVLAGRPSASQAEAEAGVNATKAMTPLTTKQAIYALGDARFATVAQGAKADSAVQSVVAGADITVDSTNPQTPIISYTGTGVTDGDKGDVTVSVDGSVWTIDSAAISRIRAPLPSGRPSLTSGVAVPSADVVNAATIYYVPCSGNNLVPVYDATLSATIARSIGAQLSLALDSNTGHALYQAVGAYDLFVIWDGSAAKLGTSYSWEAGGGSNLVRGSGVNSTEVEFFQGLWVNKNATKIRFGSGSGDVVDIAARTATLVGSFFATGAGLTMDTAENRLISSAYSPALRRLRRQDAGTWTRTTGVFGLANSNAGNRVAVMSCLSGVHVSLEAISMAYNSTATERTCCVAIANDADVIPAECAMGWFGTVATPAIRTGFAKYEGQPGMGLRNLKWFERGNGTDTQTFFGSSDQNWHTGLVGSVLN